MCNNLKVKCRISVWRECDETPWQEAMVNIPFVMLPKPGDIIWVSDVRVLVKEVTLDMDNDYEGEPYYCIECDCSEDY